MRLRASRTVALAATLVGAVAACDRGYEIPPPAPGVVELYEWQILATAPEGNTITFVNGGLAVHNGVIATTDGEVLATSGLLQSGEAREVAWAGYDGPIELTCRIVEVRAGGTLEDHVEAGMHLEAEWPA